MGYLSRACDRVYDKLPDRLKILFGVCAIVGIVYGVAHWGWAFLVKVFLALNLEFQIDPLLRTECGGKRRKRGGLGLRAG